jgi:probable F420-dependent oxidoreductase
MGDSGHDVHRRSAAGWVEVKPFRFAIQVNGATDVRAWRDLARRTEDLGYATLYVPDHFTEQWGPWVALTTAAEATSTLRVGALVFDNDYRHPLVLAKEAATLDLVSEGRFELGLGAGWMRTDYEQTGIPYDEPAVRVDRLEEALEILGQLWGSGSASFEGDHYRVREAPAQPPPFTPGGPRLVVGGGGRRVLSLAARHAHVVGVNPSLRSGAVDQATARSAVAELFDQRVAWIREAAGERFDDLELQLLTYFAVVGADPGEIARTMAPALGLSEQEAMETPLALVGSVEQLCDQLHERRERWGFSYVVVHEAEMDAFADVVSRLAGT